MAVFAPTGRLRITVDGALDDVIGAAVYFATDGEPVAQDPDSPLRGFIPAELFAPTDNAGEYDLTLSAAGVVFPPLDGEVSAAVALVDDFGNEQDLSEAVSFPFDNVLPPQITSLQYIAP